MKYFLFGAYKDMQGGAFDFLSAHETLEKAMEVGLGLAFAREPRLSSWAHIAEFNGQSLRVVWRLNIPDTEQEESDTLEWIRPWGWREEQGE